MNEWSFTVPGEPVPQGSLKYVGHTKPKHPGDKGRPILVSDNPELKQWRSDVAWMAKGAHVELAGKRQPIAIEALFRFQRSASNSDVYMTIPPDVDKLARAVLDALKGIAYVDDAQVADLHPFKQYGPVSQAEITVRWLGQLI